MMPLTTRRVGEVVAHLGTIASASMGATWGWLLMMLMRPQRATAGYIACSLATHDP